MAHPHEEMLRRAYADFARGDLAAYLNSCTDAIVFRVPGRSIVAGTYDKRQFGADLIAKVIDATGGTFRETVLDVVANDTRGVVLARHEFERNGRTRSYNTAHIYRIENGRLAAFEEYPEDLYAFDAAWS